MEHKFKNCPVCDFEWHSSDGDSCPVCSSQNRTDPDDLSEDTFYKSGLFGTDKSKTGIRAVYQILGILALVYFLYRVFGGS